MNKTAYIPLAFLLDVQVHNECAVLDREYADNTTLLWS